MPQQMQGMSAGLKRALSGFTSGQKAVTGLALVGLLLVALVFSSWSSKPELVPLFTGLESVDAAAITEQLTTIGTTYDLTAGGTTVLVPQKDVYQLRIDMAAEGLPANSTSGYALLDNQGMMTSEFRQRVDYQRALEGELSKTITSIDGIAATTVHLVMPEENLFSEDARQPSASVLVKNKPGESMTPNQVQAVVNLVSSSVEGLQQENVTVADSKGNVLSTAGEDGVSLAAGDARATQTAMFEKNLQTSVEQMLAPVVGAGKAVVRVTAQLNFDRRETTSESFGGPTPAPVMTERIGNETYTGTGTVVGGVLGPENVTTPGGGASDYTKEQGDRTFGVDKVTEQTTSAPGAVERLSVAVILDDGAAPGVAPAQVQQLVMAAAGLDAARGDVVQVSRMAFDTTAAEAATAEFAQLEAGAKSQQRWAFARTAGVLLVVGLLLLYALRTMRRDRRSPVELPMLELEASQLSALEAEEAAMLAAARRLALNPPAIAPEQARRLAVQAEVGELVERQPEEVAQLLRGWLADRGQ